MMNHIVVNLDDYMWPILVAKEDCPKPDHAIQQMDDGKLKSYSVWYK